MIDTSFMNNAKCKGHDTNFFFSENPGDTHRSVLFCQDCPVKDPCGQYAIHNRIPHGVFGGLSVRARTKIIRSQLI